MRWDMFDEFLKICGAISLLSATLVMLYKGYRLLFSVKSYISYTLNFDGTLSDSLSVTITNHSIASIYVRACKVRSTYSLLTLAIKHLHRPLLSPRLYPNLRYNSAVYALVGDEPIKLEPGQLVELKREIYEHPLNALNGPMRIAFVQLTTGRVVRSKRMKSPSAWRLISRRNSAHA
ncbi:hypothetical protein [Neopusillimonas maritima]|uniref:Uncharacterized protein n=1 Tax=Neopusillimonas maritima TaxID=2026239 RepID=A0A3A1Z2C8_9BURK|nr:hypothetical protein [Neopusillimonas maritima]RIY42557.1 hypothetical protein CJP73_03795 [Neopusillimonas maritima]